MRSLATQVGDEGGDLMILEQNYVGGREIACNQNGVLGARAQFFRHRAALTGECGDDAFGDLAHIGFAFAQILVFHFREVCEQLVELQFQCPFGVARFAFDDLLRRLGKCRIVENHPMHGDKCGHITSGVAALRGVQIVLKRLELGAHLLHRFIEALYFARNEFFRNRIVIYLQRRAGEQMCMANGDATADTQAVEREAHAPAANIKHWCGSQADNGWRSAPVLEFGCCKFTIRPRQTYR